MAIDEENACTLAHAASADFNKYRTVVGSSIYVPVDFNK